VIIIVTAKELPKEEMELRNPYVGSASALRKMVLQMRMANLIS